LRESLSKQGKTWRPSRVDRRSRDSNEGYAAERVIHELLITEFMLAVWQTIEKRPDLELLTVERRSLAKHPAFGLVMRGRNTCVMPDAMFLFRYKQEGMCCCFLELDNGTMNAKQVRAKFGRYEAWVQSASGQQYLVKLYERYGAKASRPMFRLLIVARNRTGLDDDGRLSELLTAVNRTASGVRKRIWLTTVAALREHQHDDHPLDANVWLRPSDLDSPAESILIEKGTARRVRHCLF
jgi:hypothetical protein